MRCDLHVHSRHSGPADLPILRHVARECYSEPQDVYETARRRGMDLVTITDHDTIEGIAGLRDRPDVFVSEEVTCGLTEGRVLHLGVFDITEEQHGRIASRRTDAEALFADLAEQRIPVCVNHLFSTMTGKREPSDFRTALKGASLVEALNGTMPPRTNHLARAAAQDAALPLVGGSDAHTLAAVASCYTEVPSARSREEFLEGLRCGFTIPKGRSGSYARLTAEVTRIYLGVYRDAAMRARQSWPWAGALGLMLLGLPTLALVPVFTAVIHVRERISTRRHIRRSHGGPTSRPNAIPWRHAWQTPVETQP